MSKEHDDGIVHKGHKVHAGPVLHGLQDVYYAERQIVKSLPSMIDKATNRELAKALRDHLQETEHQVARLQKVFENLGESPEGGRLPGHRRTY
jgi:ferritin-like metal-binding protein YciE